MKLLRRRLSVFFALVILLSCLSSTALAASIGDNQISSAGAIVIDFETGVELYAYNAEVTRVPASLTKLLAAYVVYDAIDAGEISLDTMATISAGVSSFSYNREYSNVPMARGAQISIGRLLEFVLLYSGCAATDALAEALCGGNAWTFVNRMNDKVASLGIDAVFYDTYGGSADNRISPRGLAVLTRSLISDHPEILTLAATPSFTYGGTTYENTNLLLGLYDGIDGLKTGYTSAAGYCFVGTAARDGRRIISVTMGSSSKQTRFPDTETLLNYGFLVADGLVAEYFADKILPSSSMITVNGNAVMLTVYNIGDYHYFKLRDIAFLLMETEKQFEAQYDEETDTVYLTSALPYTAVGDELDLIPADSYCKFTATSSKIYLDDTECTFEVYNINDYNYFKLRDIAALINFGVDWDGETQTVLIDTSRNYTDGETDGSQPDEDLPEDGEAEEPDNGDTAEPEDGEDTPPAETEAIIPDETNPAGESQDSQDIEGTDGSESPGNESSDENTGIPNGNESGDENTSVPGGGESGGENTGAPNGNESGNENTNSGGI